LIENDKATVEWLNSQKHSTAIVYKCLWQHFLEFTGLNGDQILDERKSDKNYAMEKKVLQFKSWMISQKGQSENTAKAAAMAVRGFFAFFRVPLQFRRSESAKLTESTRKTEDYLFNKEDLKKMFDVADLTEKYVLTAGKSFGLRAGDFIRLTRGNLEPYLNRETPIGIGEYVTQKERVKAYPFIDSDALPVIKLMIEKMDRQGRTNSSDRLLTFKDEIQLSRVLKRLVEKAGINAGDKQVRFHSLRKFLIDRISSVMSESKWKQIIGKKIYESAYVSPENLRQDYARAVPETCFTELVREGDVESIAKKQVLIELAKNMGITEEQMTTMFKVKKAQTATAQIKSLRTLIAQKRKRAECDGGDCGEQFEQVSETELLQRLKSGWIIVHRLASGEVIVRR